LTRVNEELLTAITEHTRVEAALRKSEARYWAVTQSANDAIVTVNDDGTITGWNLSAESMFGYPEVEVLGQPLDLIIPRQFRERHRDGLKRLQAGGEHRVIGKTAELAGLRKDGSEFPMELSLSHWEILDGRFYTGIIRDITERKQAEQALRVNEAMLQSILDNSSTVVFLKDMEGCYITINRRYEELFHVTRKDVVGKSDYDIFPREHADRFRQHDLLALHKGSPFDVEEVVPHDDGLHTYISVKFPIFSVEGKPYAVCGIATDITERKRMEEALKRKEEESRLLAKETEFIAKMGRIISSNINVEEVYGRFAEEVSKVISFDRLSVNIINRAEGRVTVAYAAGLPIPGRQPGDVFSLAGSTNELVAIARSGLLIQPKIEEEVDRLLSEQQPSFKAGLRSQMAVPLISEDQVIGILNFLSKKQNAFTDADLKLGEAIGIQITGAIAGAQIFNSRLQAEEKLQQTLENLRKAVGTTIQVLAYTVETRDPYTAGHQTRSADLARAIGTEMELPQEKIDAIRIAGSIHDIGKLSIPAEILSKPTKLSEIEFALIKEHSRKGYEMLKDVESPWPLAEIVYQHHERIDGSGYPRNLKREEILIEARILAVADVVEAMASHRPYRPGLGIEAALNEIEKNSGLFYDNAVADACLRLFREKGFQLAVT
jgi:PAS domain S-box-containing protein